MLLRGGARGADVRAAGDGVIAIQEAYGELVRAFKEMELPYAVGGSIASGAYGVSRATQDVDLVVDLSPEEAFVGSMFFRRRFLRMGRTRFVGGGWWRGRCRWLVRRTLFWLS